MSSRDCCTFVKNPCSENTEWSGRTQAGLGHSKCKVIQYEQTRAVIEAKRLSSHLSQQKVQKVLHAAQVQKERSVLRLHRQVWLKEHHRLNIARHKTERELQQFLRGVGSEEADMEILSQLQQYELELEMDREEFQFSTVEPVYQLREDVQCRLASHRSTASPVGQDVSQQVQCVRRQQTELMDRLQCECESLQQDICVNQLKEQILSAAAGTHVERLEEVPEEICTEECPDPDLRSDLIHSFHSLSDKYKLRLAAVESRLQGLDRNCGWTAADHECFQHIMSQYSSSLRNQRSLYTDMMQRLLPHISRRELRAHERWSDWHYFSVAQKSLVLQSWARDRSELLLRALSVLEDCRTSHSQQQLLQNQRAHQHNICRQLREKLQQWRTRQEEAAELEAALADYWHKEEEERLRKEQQREKNRRSQLTQQINRLHAEKQKKREEKRKRDMERLAELRRAMEEQMQCDKERVKFREEQLQQKLQMRETKEKQKQKDDKEREERLQALCNQVSKVAEADPERMMGDTVAWRGRHFQKKCLHRKDRCTS